MSRQNDWNREHYEKIGCMVKKGARAELKKIAEEQGLSLAAYIRHALIKAAKADGYGDISAKLGGGGEMTFERFKRLLSQF